MIEKMKQQHLRCFQILSDIQKEDNKDNRNILYQMYSNTLIEIIRGPIESILEASAPNAVPISDELNPVLLRLTEVIEFNNDNASHN
mgnify:CR=1 FL=1